jgi:hypothetical protein
MVTCKKNCLLAFLIIIQFLLFIQGAPAPAVGQEIRYHLEHQYSKIWVNMDGTIELLYDIEIACDLGKITQVWIGQPNKDFTIEMAFDDDGNPLEISKDFELGSDVLVVFRSPISAGESLSFNLTTIVEKMIWLDEDNPGNVGLMFIPTWWDEIVEELRVLIVLPEGATADTVKNTPNWDNTFLEEQSGRLVLYWERSNLQPGERFNAGVSFSKELVDRYEARPNGGNPLLTLLPFIMIPIASIIVVVIVIFNRRKARKRPYRKPKMRIESLGIRRGLTAVEAAWLLGLGPIKLVVAIFYGLLRKRAIWVVEREPKLRFGVQQSLQNIADSGEIQLRYYEYRFIRTKEEDGTLNEDGLAGAVRLIRDTVEQKMRGYNRSETIQHYRKIVDDAWRQVEEAGTPDLLSEAFDENLLWLLMDEDFDSKIRGTMEDRIFVPHPGWWWYWGLPRPQPTPPTQGPPSESTEPQSIPGGEFADRIVSNLEESANKLVTNLEKFADAVTASPRAQARSSPVRKGSGGFCACASCACACACVSCACACAGGRVK